MFRLQRAAGWYEAERHGLRCHDHDLETWKRFPHYWTFVKEDFLKKNATNVALCDFFVASLMQLVRKQSSCLWFATSWCLWDELLRNQNTEQKWQTIKEKITTGCDLYVPMKAVNPVNPRPMWMNKGTLRSIRKKHKAWAKIVGSPTAENYILYKKARNQARWETRKSSEELRKRNRRKYEK